MSDVLTLSEVASLLKVHPNTIYRLARSGKLPAFKTGTDWRFERSAVEAWMRGRSTESVSNPEDEALHIVYWMLSHGFSLAVSVAELTMLLDWPPRTLQRALRALSRRGLLTHAHERVALTPEGMSEARRRFGAHAQAPTGHESVRIFAERYAR